MFIDLTVRVTRELQKFAGENEKKANFGHLGTHFDVMDKEFPIDNFRKEAIMFHVQEAGQQRDIEISDINPDRIEKGAFVIFHTGFIEQEEYGTRRYFTEHPQLSDALIDVLLEKGVSMIGIDCAGVRRGKEHTPKDQYCADRGVFIIENLCHLEKLPVDKFTVNTYPINFEGMTGLPCRVVAEI